MRDRPANHVTTRRKRRNSASPVPYLLVLGCAAIAIFIYTRYQPPKPAIPVNPKPSIVNTGQSNIPIKPQSGSDTDRSLTDHSPNAYEGTDNSANPESSDDRFPVPEPEHSSSDDALSYTELLQKNQHEKQWAENQRALTNIELFYTKLDDQKYLEPLGLKTPSRQYFSSLIQKLLNNPPLVTGETDDLFNLLQNTAHFFRVVGKQNIVYLKAILSQEKDSFEEVLADYYALSRSPEFLSESFNVHINEQSLYDYAGFFLTTMGGRLYLFRRDSVSRMVVSYYSILIVEEANRNGRNSHGIDIRPAVTMLIDELESSGAQLKLRDEYLDTLYMIKERYL